VCRFFDSSKEKNGWMRMYCDSWDWMRCPYAADIDEAYLREEKGDQTAVEKQAMDSMRKEIMSLQRKLGRRDKRIERMQKKIDSLRAVNESFVTVNENAAKQKRDYYERWRKAQAEIDKGNEEIQSELLKLGAIYEQRMCYLIEKYAGGKFYDDDVEAWAEDKEFALVTDFDEDQHRRYWKVVFNEDDDKGISGDDREEA
jgi:hypothetical protein